LVPIVTVLILAPDAASTSVSTTATYFTCATAAGAASQTIQAATIKNVRLFIEKLFFCNIAVNQEFFHGSHRASRP
jgi:hypothetical protein